MCNSGCLKKVSDLKDPLRGSRKHVGSEAHRCGLLSTESIPTISHFPKSSLPERSGVIQYICYTFGYHPERRANIRINRVEERRRWSAGNHPSVTLSDYAACQNRLDLSHTHVRHLRSRSGRSCIGSSELAVWCWRQWSHNRRRSVKSRVSHGLNIGNDWRLCFGD